MRNIEMVDLKSQYQKIKPDIDKGIQEVLDNASFIAGKQVQEFAVDLGKYAGVKNVIPCANGTDALQIAMMALDLQPGDEVITPSFTYFATVEVIALLKCIPVFVDVNPETFTIDVTEIEKAISPKTKVIVPVHLYGQAANMEPILALAAKHKIAVVEDNAQAIGGEYTFSNGDTFKNGSMALISTTSFFPSKNLGCYGDGGAIFTNNDELALKLKMIANHGQRIKYYHDLIGCNSRLDTLQAAILRVKLKHLDSYCNARRTAADFYDKAFANHPKIKTPFRASYAKHVYHQYTLILSDNVDRESMINSLKEKGIPTMLYYPLACHKQKAFEKGARIVGDLKNTEWLSPRVLSLPIHTEMDEEQLNYIASSVLEFLK